MSDGARRRIAAILTGAALAILALAPAADANSWPSDGFNSLNTRWSTRGPTASKGTLPGKLWQVSFTGDVTGTPIIGNNGLVYVATTLGEVRAYIRDTGALLWTMSASGGKPAPIYGSPLLTNDALYVVVSRPGATTVVALDPINGSLKWAQKVESNRDLEARASPAYSATKNLIYIALCACTVEQNYDNSYAKGKIIALNASTGAFAWLSNTANRAGGGISGTPLVIDGLNRVYVATGHSYYNKPGPGADQFTDSVLAFNSGTGALEGHFQTRQDDGGPNSDLNPLKGQGFAVPLNAFNAATSTGLGIGAGAGDGYYYAVNPQTLELLYKVQVGAPSALGGVVSAAATDSKVIIGRSAVPSLIWGLKGGALSWALPNQDPLNTGPVSAGSKIAWYTDAGGFVNTFDPSNGRPMGKYPLGAPSTAGVSLGYGKAFVGIGTGKDTGGGILALR